jgi:dTMP kinase
MYYVIEGQDSTGKTTQANLLADYLRGRGREVEIVEEPGGDLPIAQEIRRMLLDKRYNLHPKTNVMLFMAARSELWHKRIKPVLDRGGDVISTRNWWSTLAYQGFGQGIDLALIRRTVSMYMPKEYVMPEKSIIFFLPEEERLRRQRGRNYASEKDTYESQPSEFQMRVNNGYLEIAKMYGVPIYDASGSPEQVRQDLWKHFGILQPTHELSESTR